MSRRLVCVIGAFFVSSVSFKTQLTQRGNYECKSIFPVFIFRLFPFLFLLRGHFWFLSFSLFTLPFLFIPFSFISLYSLIFSCREEDGLFAAAWSGGRGWWFVAWFRFGLSRRSVVSLRGLSASVGCSIREEDGLFAVAWSGGDGGLWLGFESV